LASRTLLGLLSWLSMFQSAAFAALANDLGTLLCWNLEVKLPAKRVASTQNGWRRRTRSLT
jgi:hypothetical protein